VTANEAFVFAKTLVRGCFSVSAKPLQDEKAPDYQSEAFFVF